VRCAYSSRGDLIPMKFSYGHATHPTAHGGSPGADAVVRPLAQPMYAALSAHASRFAT
jgi:hypothetical protein